MTAHGVGDGDLRRRYAQVFDDVAEEYDRERRGYPDELIDAACREGALSAGDRVVEVGCGTGLLTTSLLAPGGMLALLQHCDVWDASTVDDWRALHAALEMVAPEIASPWPELRDADAILNGAAARSDNISAVWSWIGRHDQAVPEAARLFDNVRVTVVPVDTEQTGDQLNAYLRTTSLYRRLEPHQRPARVGGPLP